MSDMVAEFNTMARAEHLRERAAHWRARARETLDPYFIKLMTGAADDLEAEARSIDSNGTSEP